MSDEKSAAKKRVTPANLAMAVSVVVLIQAFALLITKQNGVVYVQIVNSTGYSFNPLGPSPAGATGNAILLVGLAFVLTLVLVWLLKKKMVMSFRVLIFGSLALSAFILTSLTADIFAQQYLPQSLEVVVAYGTAALVVVLIGYTMFIKNRLWLSTLILAFVGAEVGSFFAETLPPYTALALPIAFSAYDVYAVFRGPLRTLIGTAPSIALVGMTIKAGEFTLGLGDIVFYTMLPSLALFWVGATASIVTVAAIDAGVIVTLYLLSKRRLLPGLPIPMLLGVLTFAFYFF